MANRKLKKEILKHFKQVDLVYNKRAFDSFFNNFTQAYHTDHMDLTNPKDEADFNLLYFTIILAFEEHEHLIKKLNKVTQSVTQRDTNKITQGDTQWK